jgi:hypothetical protein
MIVGGLNSALLVALEAWPAVVGAALIPILGLVGGGYLIIRAVRDTDEEDAGEGEPRDPPSR